MKKSSKVLGSVALSAALVMGTAVPAFADTLSTETDGSNPTSEDASKQTEVDASFDTAAGTAKGAANNFSAIDTMAANKAYSGESGMNGASTVVNVSTYTSQISVTVPLTLPVQLDTAGGVGYAPSEGHYYIANNSTIPLKVSNATYAIKKDSTDWNFCDESYFNLTSTSAANLRAPMGTVSKGSFVLRLTAQSYNESANTYTDISGSAFVTTGTSANNYNHGNTPLKDWNIAAAASTDPSDAKKLPLKVEVASSTLKQSVESAPDAGVAGIVYTVQKAN